MRNQLKARHLASIAVFGFAVAGCSIESPQSPRFETILNIPALDKRYTARELIDSSTYLESDPGSPVPRVTFDGDIDPVTAGDALMADVAGRTISGQLDAIQADDPPPLDADFSLTTLSGIPVPPGGTLVVIPAINIAETGRPFDPFDVFTSAVLSDGAALIVVTNDLPVPLVSPQAGMPAIRVRLKSQDGTTLIEVEVASGIAAGEQRTIDVPLAGTSIERDMIASVEGFTPGSNGQVVFVDFSDGIHIDATLSDLEFSEVTLAPDAQEVTRSDEIQIDDGVRLETAVVADGRLIGQLRNTVPLPLEVTVTFPEVTRNGSVFIQSFSLPAAIPPRAAVLPVTIDISDAEYSSETAGGSDRFRVEVHAQSQPQATQVTLSESMQVEFTLDPATVSFDSIEGVFDARAIEITPEVTMPDLPDELEGVHLAAATLTLEVENEAAMSAVTDLVIIGSRAGRADVTLPVTGHTIHPGAAGSPQTTQIVIDAAGTNLLELIEMLPETVRLEGRVLIGDGVTSGSVRRTDTFRGSYVVHAPLRIRFDEIRHTPDAFNFDVSVDAQEQILDHVTGAAVHARIGNRFPVGTRLTLTFGVDEESAVNAPTVSLEPVLIDASPPGAEGRASAELATVVLIPVPADKIPFFARDVVWGSALVELMGPGDETFVEVLSTDYVHVSALARFTYRVEE